MLNDMMDEGWCDDGLWAMDHGRWMRIFHVSVKVNLAFITRTCFDIKVICLKPFRPGRISKFEIRTWFDIKALFVRSLFVLVASQSLK